MLFLNDIYFDKDFHQNLYKKLNYIDKSFIRFYLKNKIDKSYFENNSQLSSFDIDLNTISNIRNTNLKKTT